MKGQANRAASSEQCFQMLVGIPEPIMLTCNQWVLRLGINHGWDPIVEWGVDPDHAGGFGEHLSRDSCSILLSREDQTAYNCQAVTRRHVNNTFNDVSPNVVIMATHSTKVRQSGSKD